MADELWTMREWIFDTLAASNDLTALLGGISGQRIFQGLAAQSAPFPLIQIRYISPVGGGDFETLNFTRLWTRARFLVVAVVNTPSYKSIHPIAKLADDLLHRQNGYATDGRVHYCKREAPYNQEYQNDGIQYREAGAFWEIAARVS
jgi:hypothetical protein